MLSEYEQNLVNEIGIELDSMRDSFLMDEHKETYLTLANHSFARAKALIKILTSKPVPASISQTGSLPDVESDDIVGAIGSSPGFIGGCVCDRRS